jgi:hypothetical protein
MPVDEAWKSVRLLTDKVLPALTNDARRAGNPRTPPAG